MKPTGAFALPLLCEHFLARAACRGDGRSDAPRHPVPRAGLVGAAGLGPQTIGGVAPKIPDTDTLILPVHFPRPTAGLLKADGDRFDYRFKRD